MTNRGGPLRPDGKRTARERRRDRYWRRKFRNMEYRHVQRLAGRLRKLKPDVRLAPDQWMEVAWDVHRQLLADFQHRWIHGDPKVSE